MSLTRYSTLLAGAIAIVVAAWEFAQEGTASGDTFATAMLTLGLVLIGAWLAIEIWHMWNGSSLEPPPDDEELDG